MKKTIGVFLSRLIVISGILLNGCKKDVVPVAPTVTTYDVTSYGSCSVNCFGLITSDGGKPIIERGVCWSTNETVTIDANNTTDVTDQSDGYFFCQLTGLIPNTTYFIRVYAKNTVGIRYGEVKSVTTQPMKTPIVTTLAFAISPNTATVSGSLAVDCSATETERSAYERGVYWGTTQNPSIADNKSGGGSGSGFFSISITGLTANTTYYVRAYATNDAGTIYGNEVSFTTFGSNSIQDIEGNYYNKITIGTQVWMKENLRATKYSDGTTINKVTNPETWFTNLITGSYGENFYNSTDVLTYGRIYNSYAVVDSRNICPVSWHVPTDAEWTTLETYLGGSSIAGGKLKSTIEWSSPNTGATNESGFSAISGSYPVKPTGINGVPIAAYYSSTGIFGYWWSSSGNIKRLEYNSATIFNGGQYAQVYSVRCLKD